MVVEPVHYFDLFVEIRLLNKRFKFAFSKHVIVPMVYCGLLVLIFDRRLDEVAILWLGIFCQLRLLLLVSIVEVPGNKDILGSELFMFLLICPHVNQHSASNLENPDDFAESLDSKTICGEVMDHCD